MTADLLASLRFLLAIAWLLALYWSTPLFGRRLEFGADRLRDTLVLAVGIPFCLGFLGALTPWTCLAAAVVLLVLGRVRSVSAPSATSRSDAPSDLVAYAIVAATVIAVAWPQFVRPPLDGDSLAYHLPNAASWATAHSFWTSATMYWWYPPGSELLATDMLLIGGVASLPLAGSCAALLLGCRLAAFARAAQFNAWQSGALAAAFISIPMIALQAGTLQNDLWLTAWLLEIVWSVRRDKAALYRAIGMAALVKPVGIVFVVVAWAPLEVPLGAIVALMPFGLWVLRDAVLTPNATISFAQTATIDPLGTSIAAHGIVGITTFGQAIFDQGLPTAVLVGILVVSPFVSTSKRLWLTALAFTVIFAIEPYGFNNNGPQLANGQSLRYVMPALGIAFVTVLESARRFPYVASAVAAILIAIDVVAIERVFWNDATTHASLIVAIGLLAAILGARAARRPEFSRFALVAVALYAAASISREPIRYYEAEFTGTRIFDWLSTRRPEKAIVWDLRGGMVTAILPTAVVEDASSSPCAQARRDRAILIAADTFDPNPSAFAQRRIAVKSCGPTLYEDPFFLIVSPGR